MALPGRPPATTFEHIESHAVREPTRIAIAQEGRHWTYDALYADLKRAIRLLHEIGVRPGQRVAVGTDGFQPSMLLLLAAETIGAVTTFFLPEGDPDSEPLFRIVDWVVSDRVQVVPPAARLVVLDDAFVRRFQATAPGSRDDLPLHATALGEPQRIARTSGSSGLSKFMVLSRTTQEYWVNSAISTLVLRHDSRLLVLGPLVMNGMYSRASACLRLGAVAMAQPESYATLEGLTHLASLPLHLGMLLDSLPPGYVAARPVDVFVVGGFFPAHMRDAVARTFRGRIVNRYGTNETGAICDDIDAGGIGVVSPGVDVRILGESGEEVPAGQLGVIAVRTPCMVEGYVDDAEATMAAFADGWFRSGDWGALVAPRVLRLAGRHDDLVNIAGLKYAARDVEMKLRELVNPVDCAILAVNTAQGRASLGVALVVAEGVPREDIVRRIDEALHHASRVLFVDSIPMLPSGKVDRLALHRMFQ